MEKESQSEHVETTKSSLDFSATQSVMLVSLESVLFAGKIVQVALKTMVPYATSKSLLRNVPMAWAASWDYGVPKAIRNEDGGVHFNAKKRRSSRCSEFAMINVINTASVLKALVLFARAHAPNKQKSVDYSA